MVKTEEVEALEVVGADAVAQPGTVVVHLGHADFAYRAVVRPIWFPVVALHAEVLLVRNVRLLRNLDWGCEGAHKVACQIHDQEKIEQTFDCALVKVHFHPLVYFLLLKRKLTKFIK